MTGCGKWGKGLWRYWETVSRVSLSLLSIAWQGEEESRESPDIYMRRFVVSSRSSLIMSAETLSPITITNTMRKTAYLYTNPGLPHIININRTQKSPKVLVFSFIPVPSDNLWPIFCNYIFLSCMFGLSLWILYNILFIQCLHRCYFVNWPLTHPWIFAINIIHYRILISRHYS